MFGKHVCVCVLALPCTLLDTFRFRHILALVTTTTAKCSASEASSDAKSPVGR